MFSFLINALKIIFLLGFLVFIHEGGHFLVAKLCKVKVNEFAIGFGPTLISKIKGDTKYALHLIPLGGFVSMEGEEERSDEEGSFSNAGVLKKIAIVFAGGAVNIVFGLLVYFLLISSIGNFSTNVVDYSLDNYPAKSAGIMAGDQILSINNKKVKNGSDINKYLLTSKEEEVILELKRNNEKIDIKLKPANIEDNYYLGIVFRKAENTFFNKVYCGFINTGDFIVSIFDNLKELFTGKVNANQMVGIVGISDIVVKTSGIYEYIYMLALISLSLGITNLLPFPPLDGGKIVIYLIEAVRKEPMKEKIEIQLQMIGFAILILLSLYVTYNDILRII